MKTSFKKLTCLFLSILMIMSVAITGVSAATVAENPTSADTNTCYVDLSAVASIGSSFFIWKWPKDGNGSWYTLTNVSGDIYSFELTTNENFIVAAFPGGTSMPDNNWTNKQAQTENIIDYTGAHNCCIITVGGTQGIEYAWADYDGTTVNTTAPTSLQTLPTRTAPTGTTKETEPVSSIPTFATEADEDEFLYVAAQSNLDLNGVKTKTTGNEITVTYTLTADQIIDGGQAVITYDPNKLGLSAKNTAELMFPVAKGVAYNLNAGKGQIMFNFSTTDNDFTQGGAFVSLVFDRKYNAVGQTDVWMEVTDLTSKNTTYVEDGVVATTTGISVATAITEVEVAEPTIPTLVATDAVTDIDVRVSSNLNDAVTDIKVDKANVKVTFDLKVADPIAFGNAVVTFDDSVLALEDYFNTRETMFSTLSSGVSYNLNAAQGTMKFNFAGVDAANNKGLYDFSNGGTLVTLVFTVKAGSTGRADINLNVENLGTMNKDYVEDSLINETVEVNVAAAAEEATTSPTAPTKDVIASGVTTSPTKQTDPIESSSVTESTEPTTESTQPTTESTEPTAPKPTQPATKAPSMKLKAEKIKAGQTTQAVVSNANGKKATFKSLKTKVATVNKNTGVITGLAKGSAKIQATVGGKTIIKKVKVTTNPKVVNGKKALKNKGKITVNKGKKLKLKITGKVKSINNTVKFTKKGIAKNTAKLKKANLIIKGLKKGTTKLKVTLNGVKKYTFTVKVK